MGQVTSTDATVNRILICGLDGAGKTTLLFKLTTGEVVSTDSTIGVNIDTVSVDGENVNLWDFGGGEKMRPIWSSYRNGTHAVIWVVDVHDRDRLAEQKDELAHLLTAPDVQHVPVAIVANKQDLPGGITNMELVEGLSLRKLKQPWHIFKASAITGEGMQPCLEWIQHRHRQTPANTSFTFGATVDEAQQGSSG